MSATANTLTINQSSADWIVGYQFTVCGDGSVSIVEIWTECDELYGDRNEIPVPPDVWRQAAPWIAQRLALLSHARA